MFYKIGTKINTPDGPGTIMEINYYVGKVQHIGVKHDTVPLTYKTKFTNDILYYFPHELGDNMNHLLGQWMVLTDPKCNNQMGTLEAFTSLGARIKNIGIVPYDEIRVATNEEVGKWITR